MWNASRKVIEECQQIKLKKELKQKRSEQAKQLQGHRMKEMWPRKKALNNVQTPLT